jgi:hypothetical protein
MTTEFTATFTNGAFYPDVPIFLPEQGRFKITVEPVCEPPAQAANSLAVLAEMREYAQRHQMGSGGRRYRRDELYDRD